MQDAGDKRWSMQPRDLTTGATKRNSDAFKAWATKKKKKKCCQGEEIKSGKQYNKGCARDKIGERGVSRGRSDISGTFLKCTWVSKMSESEG